MTAILTAEDVVRRIAAECAYVDERGGVGIRLESAAAIVRQYGEQFRAHSAVSGGLGQRNRLRCEFPRVEAVLEGEDKINTGIPFTPLHQHRRVWDQRVAPDMVE